MPSDVIKQNQTLPRKQALRSYLVASIITAIVFLSGLFWIKLHNETDLLNETLQLKALVTNKSQAIEQHLATTLMATRMLEIQIRLHEGSRDDFNRYAPEILATTPGVSNIQLAPRGVITDIYPIAGNERAIGHDILKDDRRREEARKAVSTRKTTLAGPFELIQGGIAVIGRQPVFVQDGRQEIFWGFASALIHLEKLLSVAKLHELESQGIAYELSYKEVGTQKVKVIEKSAASLSSSWHQEQIAIPNGFWTLKVSRTDSATDHHTKLAMGLLALVSLALFFLCMHLLKQPELLRLRIEELQKRLSATSQQDMLTGLANRQGLVQQIDQLQKEYAQKPASAALILLDLDNFSRINKTFGYKKGDEILVEFANSLSSLTRETDTTARIGGDEFAILIRDISSQNDAALLTEKLLHRISQLSPDDSEQEALSASVGISLISQESLDSNKIYQNASLALQQAKLNGKNRYTFYHEPQLMTQQQGESPLDSATADQNK